MRRMHDLQRLHTDRDVVYTEHPLGQDQSLTREGFLLCRNVPIARIGMQEYLNDEICAEDDTDNELHGARGRNGIVQVDRPEEEVFRPESIASFEGKDVVDDHPDDPVTPDNYEQHTVGVTLNPRRGEGAMSDFLMADLLIKKASAIAAVRAGKREVSGGYDADYEVLGPGRARQKNIIGNHVALVDRGRCGFRCAIGDKEPDMTKTPAKKAQPSLVRRVLDALASKDRKKMDELMSEMEGEDEAPDNAVMEATGTHIHLHLGGEEAAKGGDPAKEGEADAEEAEGEEAGGNEAENGIAKRVLALESGQTQIMEALRKIASRVGAGADDADETEEGDDEDDDTDDEMQGEEEAEGDLPDTETDEETAEEGGKEKKPKDKKGKDRKGKDMKKDAAIKDSAHLKSDFSDTLAGAEILAPGLKLPTYDSKSPARATMDSLCLLKRRALAAATRDDKNGGKEAVTTMLGKRPLAGMDCASVATVFNGAVALMQDRNMQDDGPKTISEARGVRKTKDAKGPQSVADLNAAMRAHYKQPVSKH